LAPEATSEIPSMLQITIALNKILFIDALYHDSEVYRVRPWKRKGSEVRTPEFGFSS
jgi:hypothetical protein